MVVSWFFKKTTLADPLPQNHQYHCPRFPVQCPNQCGTPNIAREDLANHVKDNCGSALVLCPFKDAGCKHRVSLLETRCVLGPSTCVAPPFVLKYPLLEGLSNGDEQC